jgi:transcriptional regulator with XRE-family HTH domain
VKQETTQHIGEYIKQLRTEQGLGLRGLATKAGIDSGALSRIENGKRTPELGTLRAIATALGVPATDMLAMGGHLTSDDLPSIIPYLHTRYGQLPEETLTSINDYLKRLINDGLELHGPLALEDETNESEEQ